MLVLRDAFAMVDECRDLREWFRRFAEHEATGRSPLYAEIARGVAGDSEVLRLLCELPATKRQPNLLLAAVRVVCGLPDGWQQFRAWYLDRRDEITAVMLARRTQTNEPARCATLLPVLAQLPQPLALIEVGAAAGLCLLVDRYAYDYGQGRLIKSTVPSSNTPVFACKASPSTPIPTDPITVSWRAGLDVEPIDPADPEQEAWLKALVWPSEGRRVELLEAALSVARTDPPRVVQGDLREGIAELASQAPRNATLVVFHTAVLAYVEAPEQREHFGDHIRSLGARWVANEGYGVLAPMMQIPQRSGPDDGFVLSLDRRPVARTDPHGTWIDWL